ncbi:hypothetical protein Btru_028005 [Bulinus truncatus]|nr:hypothetical protein Btru_028005 [Bulinus truncatus]
MEQESMQHDENGHKDSEAIQEVINKVKSQGLFDQFRKECLADVDTKMRHSFPGSGFFRFSRFAVVSC